jgi:hypothetical protein
MMFFAPCPTNGVRIEYRLEIETSEVIAVEQLLAAVDSIEAKFHEEIADDLHAQFGGSQFMTAQHHGVCITTRRDGAKK